MLSELDIAASVDSQSDNDADGSTVEDAPSAAAVPLTTEDVARQAEILKKLDRQPTTTKYPKLCGGKVNLGQLFNLVDKAGGAGILDQPKKWNPIADSLVGPHPQNKGRGKQIQGVYNKVLNLISESTANVEENGSGGPEVQDS